MDRRGALRAGVGGVQTQVQAPGQGSAGGARRRKGAVQHGNGDAAAGEATGGGAAVEGRLHKGGGALAAQQPAGP